MTEPGSRHYFEWQDAGGVAVVHFTTSFLRDERMIRTVFDHIEEMITSGRTRMVIDFTGIEAFASFAIGKLIRLNERLRAPDGRLALCALTPIVEEIVDIMNLRKVFAIYPNERTALESFLASS